ncbi:hypothetical protein ElyMa_005966100 [Elysia marginata]|uniref:Uncharacterized protein n=1 Tax=Elysia marginata TaxID=1093978 RepID=A0AAV4GBV0_9GAST|nr:hypothetical protein ElyMa_005966100 [Elysia marginata]
MIWIFKMAVDTDYIITLDDFLDNKTHEENEIVITVVGPKAMQCNWEEIQTAITTLLGPAPDNCYRIYRLEEPTRWFFLAEENATEAVHGKEVAVKNKSYKIILKNVQKIEPTLDFYGCHLGSSLVL